MKKRKIYIPFPEPRPTQSIQYDFSYAKPSYVNIAGSYALKTLVKQKEGISVDLVLTMPPVRPSSNDDDDDEFSARSGN